MKNLARAVFTLLAVTWIAACVSRGEVADEYAERLGPAAKSVSQKTRILILVDGLSTEVLEKAILEGRVRNLQTYFSGPNAQSALAHTVFPSLTFPAISSLMTSRSVDETGVYGNEILRDGHFYDFDTIGSYSQLNERIQDQSIFARLARKGERSVSFDYAFQAGSTAHTSTQDLKAGLSVSDQDYAYVDRKTLASAIHLLRKTRPAIWPEFIFIHLIGVDLTSHRDGPDAASALNYLSDLDRQLGPLLGLLDQAESAGRRQIVTYLTADHGFDEPVKKTVKLEEALFNLDPHFRLLNESRLLALFFPSPWSAERRNDLLNSIAKNPDVDLVASLEANAVQIRSGAGQTAIYMANGGCEGLNGYRLSVKTSASSAASAWECADRLDGTLNNMFYPYFLANISHYFRAPFHPDAVIISHPGVAFTSRYVGQHGGPTAREVFVPLLLKNARVNPPDGVPSISELLK